ncbi:TMAO reductase system periplasmic protein TorT [Mesorhizobium sp. B3-1-6]|uniref:TMAO reductase system periplasmic protein TorT n=1 Tax=Mesorhizobium sp. B3-1-6 TaxID=2589895 RepID=UPI0015E35B73|nr:TMAO reductase system periplasmic protein TorT [Mesorhizobium sp. B3-1-6]
MRMKLGLAVGLALSAIAGVTGAKAEDVKNWGWAPYPVNAWEGDKSTPKQYELLKPEEVKQKWHLCVLMPTLTDSVFIGINYAFVQEAKRLGLKMTIFDAGGFQNLTKQLSQYDNCVALGADAILFQAISEEGLVRKVEDGKAAGIAQIAVDNMVSPNMPYDAGVFPDNYQQAYASAKFSQELFKNETGEVGILDFPGPQAANWAAVGEKAHQDALKGTNIKILATMWGNTTKNEQQRLVEDALHTYPDAKAIIGNAVMNEVAPNAIRESGHANISVIGDYLNTGSMALVKTGEVTAAPLQGSVATTVIGVDQAVRVLQKMPFDKRLTATPIMVTKDTVGKYDLSGEFGPDNWKPVFSVD